MKKNIYWVLSEEWEDRARIKKENSMREVKYVGPYKLLEGIRFFVGLAHMM
jgi:hypothetical protein